MEPKDKLAKIINGRTCCVISKGKSLEKLEQNIELFRDKNVCWIIQNKFDYIEESILKKIGKRADIISDCATVAKIHIYEPEYRCPSFLEFLGRGENNLLAISELVIEECFGTCNKLDEREQYDSKIVTIDSVFSNPNCPKEIWEPPPNSFTLLLAFLMAGQAKKIILFGIDGGTQGQDIIETYYKPDIVRAERRAAFGDERFGSVVSDGKDFEDRWVKIFETYKKAFNNPNIDIVNCSPNSIFNTFRKITYDQLEEELG